MMPDKVDRADAEAAAPESHRGVRRGWPHATILAAQFILISINFPITEVWSRHPLLHIDNAFHLYNMWLSADLGKTGNVNGYDPYFNAGGLSGIFNYLSGRFPALLAALLSPPIGEVRLYKLYVFVTAVLCPISITSASAALRQSSRETLAAGTLAILIWWVSYLHWYYTAGLVAYVAAAYLAVLFIALIVRYLDSGGGRWVPTALGCLGALGFFWHQLFPIPVAMVIVVYLALHVGQMDRRRTLAVLTVTPAASLLPNLIWLIPTYLYFDQTYLSQFASQSIVDPGLIGRELVGQFGGSAHGSKTYPLIALAALWACVTPGLRRDRRIWISFVVSWALIELIAYAGAAFRPIFYLQPNRFAPAGYVLLCIPAARGMSILAAAISDNIASARRRAALISIVAITVCGTVLTWELWREVAPGPQGRYGAPPPQVRPLGADSNWVLSWLEKRTSGDARVLYETSLGRVVDDAHMAGYFAYQSKREFIGGPYPFMNFAGFWDGFLFGKPIDNIPVAEMTEYLDTYNIGAILVHSDAAKRYFSRIPGVSVDAEHGRLKAYRVQRQGSFFLRGSGHIQYAGHNELYITDITGADIILKYHLAPGMTSNPATQLEGIRLGKDPIPFVRIHNPPTALRLRVR